MRIGIDITWLKPQISGGIESFVRNLLEGFTLLNNNDTYILFLSKDNAKSFSSYSNLRNFTLVICNCYSHKVINRIIWQNIYFNKILMKQNIDICFTPFYCKPIKKNKQIKTITVIHDLQALHFPEYFSFIKLKWLKYAWKKTVETSDQIVAISEFVKKDIITQYGTKYEKKIKVIYNPIKVNCNTQPYTDFYTEPYFYTICSAYKHKNFITLINVMEEIVKKYPQLPQILYVTGMKEFPIKIKDYIKSKNLENHILLTGYISNEERDRIISGAQVFLFPSIFEGFGMPVIEALMLGTPVVTTNRTSIPEVSCNKATYVTNPMNIQEWIELIIKILSSPYPFIKIEFPQYDIKTISNEYSNLMHQIK